MRDTALLSFRLLGSFEVIDGAADAPIVVRRKTRAALAYLAATGCSHPRQSLADLFCQDVNDPPAALRSLLSRIRRRVGSEVLFTAGDSIRFNSEAGVVDCLDFARLLEGELDSLAPESIAAVVDLYRGEFLENVQLDDSPEFELWLLNERIRYRRLYERGLAALAAGLSAEGKLAAAIDRTRQLLQSNPLREEAHADLMRLYARNGQQQAALKQYDYCRRVLQRELAVDPTPELSALRDQIAAGRLGRPQPLPVVGRKFERPESGDFVGRTTELARLRKAWDTTRPDHLPVVLVDAQAGLGKTRLVHEFAATIGEATFLTGSCYESTASLAYAPWLDLLEMRVAGLDDATLQQLSAYALEHLSRLLPTVARRLGRRRPPLPPSGADQRLRLFAAVAELLLELPHTPPLLLFIDDLHWADEASLQLFHDLARRSPTGRCLLVGAWRSEEVEGSVALQALLSDLQKRSPTRLTLPPLTPSAVRQLTGQLWPDLPAGYRPHVTDMLARATAGNPLFISEVLRELADSDEVPSALPVPRSVGELVQRRLNRLPESGRQVVEALAVLDQPATLERAQQISGRSPEETARAIDHALQRGILQPRQEEVVDRYDFTHDLMRQAVLEQLSHIRRRLLHRRTATVLEASAAPAATLAHHWRMAAEGEKEGYYARLAGEQAAALYANEEAVRYLERALSLTDEDTMRLSIMGQLGDVWLLTGEWQKAEAIFNQALLLARECEDRRQQAHFQGALGELLSRRGLFSQALAWLQKARDNAQALADRSAAASYVGTMGIVYWQQDDYDRALACYQQALEIETEMENERGVAVWTGNIGSIYNQRGDHQRALTCFERSLRLYRKLGMKREVGIDTGNVGNLYYATGDYPRALEYHRQALQIRHELGDKAGIATAVGNLGRDYASLGDDQSALACFQTALQVNLELGNWEGIALQLGRLGEVLAREGDSRQAVACYDRSIDLFRRLGAPYYLSRRLDAKAAILFALGQYASAEMVNAELLEIAAEVNPEVEFSARLRSIRLQAALGHQAERQAVDALLALEREASRPQQKAALHYEVWQLSPDSAAGRRSASRAIDLYRGLAHDTFHRQYRRRYEQMTGETLPDPPPLPVLPEVAVVEAMGLSELLSRVDGLAATLVDSDSL